MAKNTTQYLTITGKVFWARVYEPDTAFGATNYKLDLVPENDDEWAKFNASGIQKKIKEDERGKFFQLIRPAFKLIGGTVVNFTGPIIEDEDGKVIVDYVSKLTGKRVYSYDAKNKDDVERRGTPILLGNGSKVSVRLSVYDTIKGKGHRLDSIKVLDLIEYSSAERPLPELSDRVKDSAIAPDAKDEPKDESKKTPW